jgi:hypothetical protein
VENEEEWFLFRKEVMAKVDELKAAQIQTGGEIQ